MANPDLRDLTVKGIQWNFVEQFAVFGITLGSTMVLSRLLFPETYGLFGMITVLTNLAALLVNMGLGYAVIQNDALDREDLSTIFWTNMMLGALVAAIFWLSAPLISSFYGQDELTGIARAFCVIFILQGVNIVPQHLLIKKMLFKRFAAAQISATLASFAIAVALAWYGMGVWALLIQAVSQQLLASVMNVYFSRWIPRFVFKTESLKKIRRFSGNLVSSQIIDFAASNLDVILVGKYLGKTGLGLFGRSQALVMMPVTTFGFILNRTMFPWFSQLQKDPEVLRRRYLQSLKALLLLIIPAVILIGIFSSELTMIMFGERWLAMSPYVALFSAYAAFSCINSFNDSFLVSQGKTGILVRLNIAEKIILVASLLVGLRFGLMGIILGKALTIVIMFIPRLVFVCRVLGLRLLAWGSSQAGIAVGISIAVAVALLSRMAMEDVHYILRTGSSVVLSAGVYYLYLRLINETTTFHIIRIGKERWRKAFG